MDTTFYQIFQAIIKASQGNTEWQVLFFSAIAGALGHIIYSAWKGIKNTNNGSPLNFVLSYWVKDSCLEKITTLLALVVGSGLIPKFSGDISYVVWSLIGLVVGYGVDNLTHILKELGQGPTPPTTTTTSKFGAIT
jgi:hypothetical protein